MDEYSYNPADEDLEIEAPETPEDVAVLYTWANVHGGKYRDFSASRREFRAQQRHRMVEQQREAELEAARAREEAAAQEMEEVRRLEEQARHDDALRAEAEEARRRAEENIEQERLAAQRHVEVAEELKRALEEAQREMEDARRRAEEQAARYAEADARYRASARQQFIPGEIDDPYYYAGPLEPTAFAPGKGVRSSVPQRVSSERRITETYYRSKGSSDSVPARGDAPMDEEGYGLFSSGQRARGSSAGRSAYTETGPAVRRIAPPFAEARTETPEDTRERHRTDELDRLRGNQGAQGYRGGDIEDNGYYDGAPVVEERSSDPSARNSAPSNVYIPPRAQQAPPPPSRPREEAQRPRDESWQPREEQQRPRKELQRSQDEPQRLREEPQHYEPQRPREEPNRVHEEPRSSRQEVQRSREESVERSPQETEDPVPGSPHSLDSLRVRRRESAADLAARTTRRPRESGFPSAADSRGDVRIGRAEGADSSAASGHPPADMRSSQVPADRDAGEAYARRPQPEPVRGRAPELEERPEWLLNESPSGAHRDAEHRRSWDRSTQRGEVEHYPASGRQEDRRRRGDVMIPAADGGFNLPPLNDRAAPPQSRPQPATDRSMLPPEVPSQDRSEYRDDAHPRASSPMSPQGRDVQPLPVSDLGDPVPPRPVAERRRSERNSGDRLTRELRVPQSAPAPSAPVEQAPRERRIPAETESRNSGPHPADTLQQSRERVAARWFALKGLMNSGMDSSPDVAASTRAREIAVPILAVVSLSGGVGKTSLVATVGRALSSVGERVLLADATPHGLLPYYFGARELRPDVVRTFSPPPGSKDAPVFMVNYEADRLNHDEAGQTALLEEIGRHVKGTGRMLLDLNATSAWLARRLAGMNSTILVPVAADMNSVLGIKSVERFFTGLQDEGGRPQMPYYILNQFDASLPLHLDVREVLRQQLGDRLLPVMIRRSPSVAEALAEGMTVMDYAPESPVTEDYAQLADWVRKRSAPAQTTLRGTRWSER